MLHGGGFSIDGDVEGFADPLGGNGITFVEQAGDYLEVVFEGELDGGVKNELVGFGVDIPAMNLHDAEKLVVDGEGDDATVGGGYLAVEVAFVDFGLGTGTAIVGDHGSASDGFANFGVDAVYLLVVDLVGIGACKGLDVDGGAFGQDGLCSFAKGGEHGFDFVEVALGGFVGGGGDEGLAVLFGELRP